MGESTFGACAGRRQTSDEVRDDIKQRYEAFGLGREISRVMIDDLLIEHRLGAVAARSWLAMLRLAEGPQIPATAILALGYNGGESILHTRFISWRGMRTSYRATGLYSRARAMIFAMLVVSHRGHRALCSCELW